MNHIKLSVTLGSGNITFEGDPAEFRETALIALAALQENLVAGAVTAKDISINSENSPPQPTTIQMSMNSIVAKLGGSTCTELLKSAAVYLTLVVGKEKFTAKEWDDAARESKSWKINYAKQKADRRLRLVKSGYVIENQKEVYSLSSDEVARGSGLIAN